MAKETGRAAEFENRTAIDSILKKKVPHLAGKWTKKSVNCQIDENRELTFLEFLKFLNKEHRFLEQFNRSMAGVSSQKPQNGSNVAKVAASSTTSSAPPAQKSTGTTPKTTGCAACGANHQMSICDKFDGLELAAKRKTIMTSGSCFKCLESGHIARQCKANVQCETCRRPHHTKAHELQIETTTDVKTAA